MAHGISSRNAIEVNDISSVGLLSLQVKGSGRYSGQIIKYDHVHTSISDKGTPYEFESAEQLLKDFFDEVNSIMQQVNNGDKK